MSDVTIPEAVKELAVRAFYVAGFPGGDLPTAVMEQDILAMIGRAILAEREAMRERCAKIADVAAKRSNRQGTVVALSIAQAIRSSHD